mmetsp:Transcript_3094/g.3646  ORF Transcript_3094/g.3646 Transcript_3094/m.3646 type:complete len:580 (-) Transcript_3094:100-1839(-)
MKSLMKDQLAVVTHSFHFTTRITGGAIATPRSLLLLCCLLTLHSSSARNPTIRTQSSFWKPGRRDANANAAAYPRFTRRGGGIWQDVSSSSSEGTASTASSSNETATALHNIPQTTHPLPPPVMNDGSSPSFLGPSSQYQQTQHAHLPPTHMSASPLSLGRTVLTTPHRRIKAIQIAFRDGKLSPPTPVEMTKSMLANLLDCALRDLRIIDPKYAAFSSSNGSVGWGVGGRSGMRSGQAFLSRKKGIIIHVGHVRAIVMRNELLLFPSFDYDDHYDHINIRLNQEIIRHLNAVLVDSKSKPSDNPPPFELVAIEALLGHVCAREAQYASGMIQNARLILSGIEQSTFHNQRMTKATGNNDRVSGTKKKHKQSFMETQAKLGELLPLKNRVDDLCAHCAEIASSLADVLKSDEDMAAMLLTKSAKISSAQINNHFGYWRSRTRSAASASEVNVNEDVCLPSDLEYEHDEVELLFEDYLLQMDEIVYSLRAVQSSVRNTEEVVEIELDLLRNRILRLELLMELTGLSVGCGAAITGLFGMNLVSRVEVHPRMFYYTSGFIVILMASVMFAAINFCGFDSII